VGDKVDEVEIFVAAKTPLVGWGFNSFRRRENSSDEEGDRYGDIPPDFKAMTGPEKNRRKLQEQPMIVRLRQNVLVMSFRNPFFRQNLTMITF
jgi:hypothetical protein